MPQTTQENEDKTRVILSSAGFNHEETKFNLDGCALRYLALKGWKEVRGGLLIHPKDNKDEDQWEVATYLVQEWDYGIGASE